MLVLQQIKRTDNRILGNMAIHYNEKILAHGDI